MPFLLLGVAVVAAWAWLRAPAESAPRVVVGAAARQRGAPVFSLPQERWGWIVDTRNDHAGRSYVVAFRRGHSAVLRDHEIVR